MGKTLFDVTYELARLLGVTSEGIATGGSTTSLVDTVGLTQDDDFWNNGSVWVLYDAGGLGAAPQGEYSVVTDFTASSDTATLQTTLGAAIANGDRYAIARERYPLHILIQKANEALAGIPIEKDDTTTITLADGQTEYSLPSDVWKLKEVWVQQNTDDSDDNRWNRVYDWEVHKSATGTANVLHLKRQLEAGATLKLAYLTNHQTLRSATDKLDDSIHINRVVYNAAVGCLLWRKARVGESDPSINDLLNYYQNLASQMNAEFAVSYPRRSAKTIHPVLNRP